MNKKQDPYEGIGSIMGTLEAYEAEIESMILNGKNSAANRYLSEAVEEIRHALSDMSDALFDITTGPFEDTDEDD